jgi:hypothetical protein
VRTDKETNGPPLKLRVMGHAMCGCWHTVSLCASLTKLFVNTRSVDSQRDVKQLRVKGAPCVTAYQAGIASLTSEKRESPHFKKSIMSKPGFQTVSPNADLLSGARLMSKVTIGALVSDCSCMKKWVTYS